MWFSKGVGDICDIKKRLANHSTRVGTALTGGLGGNERHLASPRGTHSVTTNKLNMKNKLGEIYTKDAYIIFKDNKQLWK